MKQANMTHEEQRIFLIEMLLAEMPQYRTAVPPDEDGQKRLLRSLMNVRPVWPANRRFLEVQDEYLRREAEQKGVVDSEKLPAISWNERLVLWQGDITALKVDGIVNAANSALLGCFVPCHSCVDNIIHSVSGIQLRLKCNEIMVKQGFEEPIGQAKLTPGYNLPSQYVLHTVGPIVSGPLSEVHCRQLGECYRNCLELASQNQLKSIAFCCISTGEFHFPGEKAAEIAVRTVTDFLERDVQIERVIFNVYKNEDYEIYRSILDAGPQGRQN
ncbi:protein-ADP-ribose hydrolase [Faecalicatena contorta]|uniref:protein-ADP-ribose hydrolase n=1 Tax=Faecalicatena contorta TaxID=39482 RepID=UPI001FAA1EEF|nr:protein-ADP-ribose hydrolase [Faecalicatena contorta]